jgi:hypothetical protein
MSDQKDVSHELVVDHVLTPVPAWVIVQADWDDSVPDAILGSAWVPKGDSSNVVIKLDPKLPVPRRVYVTLLADLGMPKVLEYFVPFRPGMEKMSGMGSTLGTGGPSGAAATKDKPIIAGGQVVTVHPSVSPISFQVGAGQAALGEASATIGSTSVAVSGIVAPATSWVAISTEPTAGGPGAVLGAIQVPQGVTPNIVVPLNSKLAPGPIVAALHIDAGMANNFEYTPTDLGNSPDQEYQAAGTKVRIPVRVTR